MELIQLSFSRTFINQIKVMENIRGELTLQLVSTYSGLQFLLT